MKHTRRRGVIFDLDGTLVDSKLDFAAMRRDLGFAPDADILQTIETVEDSSERRRLEGIVHLHEMKGADLAAPFPGVHDLLDLLSKNNILVAILTRNSRATAKHTLMRVGFEIPFIVAREDAPPKPDPTGLHLIIDNWRAKKEETLFIGDSNFDLETGLRAGVPTIIFSPINLDNFHEHTEIVSNFMEIQNYLGI